MIKTGVIHGRFQLLHNDHMKYLLAGKERCQHLVIGITNPDPSLTQQDPADPERSSPDANPFTFYERYSMIRESFCEIGRLDEISIVPFPINFPELYSNYVPMDATFFLTIYDAWGEKKLNIFQSLGLKTEVMWRRPLEEKGLSAGNIRKLIIAGKPWEHLVPAAVTRTIKAPGGAARLCHLDSLSSQPTTYKRKQEKIK